MGRVLRAFSPASTSPRERGSAGKLDWGLPRVTLQELPRAILGDVFSLLLPSRPSRGQLQYGILAWQLCLHELAMPGRTDHFGYSLLEGSFTGFPPEIYILNRDSLALHNSFFPTGNNGGRPHFFVLQEPSASMCGGGVRRRCWCVPPWHLRVMQPGSPVNTHDVGFTRLCSKIIKAKDGRQRTWLGAPGRQTSCAAQVDWYVERSHLPTS